jgi:CubicO group peptidase (beta-lactamase class C family)
MTRNLSNLAPCSRRTIVSLGAIWLAVAGVSAGFAQAPHATTEPVPTTRRDRQLEARVDQIIEAELARRNAPGASVALLREDTLVLVKGYGIANRERDTPVTADTVFQIASTTKPFTAMAVMMLVEDRAVELDAPAARYLAWLPEKYREATVRQILNHTSGVARDLRRANIDEFSIEEFKRRLGAQPASFAPGARWEYSNSGYTLLSLIVESVSGQEFGQFLRQRIFDPIGMSRTGYRVAQRTDTHAIGYDSVDGKPVTAPHVFSGWGNSGIETTATDLARWSAAVRRGDLLREESWREIFTPAKLASGDVVNVDLAGLPSSSYGFGWVLTTYRGSALRSHGGAIAGFSSIVNWFHKDGWIVIVLCNGKQGADRMGQANAMARALADALIVSDKP